MCTHALRGLPTRRGVIVAGSGSATGVLAGRPRRFGVTVVASLGVWGVTCRGTPIQDVEIVMWVDGS